MAAEPKTIKTTNDLAIVAVLKPEVAFAPGGAEAIIKKVEDEVAAFKGDISTAAGRDAIASFAYKIARSKTAIDDMGKELKAEWKAKCDAIDGERKRIRDRLDELKEEVRRPLTDWEDAEKKRVADHEEAIASIPEAPDYGINETAAEIADRLAQLKNRPARDWQEFSARASMVLNAEIERTETLLARAQKREADAAELERLRAEAEARAAKEREEQAARAAEEERKRIAEEAASAEREKAEAAARAAAEAAETERRRIEAEKAEAERRAAQAERDRIAAEERAKLAAEQAERDRLAAAEKAERDRIEAVEAERRRVAGEKVRADAEAARREANKRHCAKINGEARDAIVATGVTVEQATAIVVAIAKGTVPHVSIAY